MSKYLDNDVPSKDSKILVVGCGNSQFSAKMADAGYTSIVSCDYSETVVSNMRKKYKDTHPDLKWYVADVRHLDRLFERNSFDVVIEKSCLDALLCDEGDPWNPNEETRDNMEQSLNSISNTVKVGGLFIAIGFQQPFFRKKYFDQDACSFGWEGNMTVKKIDRGLGFFYTLCEKDNVDHFVNLKMLHDSNEKVVRIYTCMFGDLWNYGHAQFCQNSRRLGGKNVRLIVGICSDDSIKKSKDFSESLMTSHERGMMASQCRWVDEVVFDCPCVLTKEFVKRMNIDMVTGSSSKLEAITYNQVALDQGIYRTVLRSSSPKDCVVSTTALIDRCCRGHRF